MRSHWRLNSNPLLSRAAPIIVYNMLNTGFLTAESRPMTRPTRLTRQFARTSRLSLLVALYLNGISVGTARGTDPVRPLSFERDIWPIFAANCISCHGAEKPKAGLDLRTVSRMTRGGKGGPAFDLADPDSSLLVEKTAQGEMPPGKARKLSIDEVSKVPRLDSRRRPS